MAETALPDDVVEQFRERYREGPDRYVRWVEDKLPVELSDAQKRILRAVAENRRVVVVGANGPGKTYAVATLVEAFLNTNRPSTVLATSGTYGKLIRTLCRPVEGLHSSDGLAHPLPGEYKQRPPRIDTGDPEWFFEASRPKDAGELEGTHNDYLLSITEEADKPAVDADVLESMDSCLTDARDRHVVIANPPKDETNIVADLVDSDAWETVRLATWDSRNVRVEIGEHPGPKIPGLLGLAEVRSKWEDWNGEDWPGLEEARRATEPADEDGKEYRRDDLDERWYRRRAGVMPPTTSERWRPWTSSDVRAAVDRDLGPVRETPEAVGIDVARSGDRTVLIGLREGLVETHYSQVGANHEVQEPRLAALISDWASPEIAVDAVGEGSGLADGLDTRFPNVTRFGAGDEARDRTTFRDCWAEGLNHLGKVLERGSVVDNALREELLVAARVLEFDEVHLDSRGGDVIEATPKSAVKDELGRSPDHLDAALQAAWVLRTDATSELASPTFSW